MLETYLSIIFAAIISTYGALSSDYPDKEDTELKSLRDMETKVSSPGTPDAEKIKLLGEALRKHLKTIQDLIKSNEDCKKNLKIKTDENTKLTTEIGPLRQDKIEKEKLEKEKLDNELKEKLRNEIKEELKKDQNFIDEILKGLPQKDVNTTETQTDTTQTNTTQTDTTPQPQTNTTQTNIIPEQPTNTTQTNIIPEQPTNTTQTNIIPEPQTNTTQPNQLKQYVLSRPKVENVNVVETPTTLPESNTTTTPGTTTPLIETNIPTTLPPSNTTTTPTIEQPQSIIQSNKDVLQQIINDNKDVQGNINITNVVDEIKRDFPNISPNLIENDLQFIIPDNDKVKEIIEQLTVTTPQPKESTSTTNPNNIPSELPSPVITPKATIVNTPGLKPESTIENIIVNTPGLKEQLEKGEEVDMKELIQNTQGIDQDVKNSLLSLDDNVLKEAAMSIMNSLKQLQSEEPIVDVDAAVNKIQPPNIPDEQKQNLENLNEQIQQQIDLSGINQPDTANVSTPQPENPPVVQQQPINAKSVPKIQKEEVNELIQTINEYERKIQEKMNNPNYEKGKEDLKTSLKYLEQGKERLEKFYSDNDPNFDIFFNYLKKELNSEGMKNILKGGKSRKRTFKASRVNKQNERRRTPRRRKNSANRSYKNSR